ncbi:hypothetical protein [Cnuella takakiae]|nr:hypothetical protein [Cnuella takakiae]OLY93986.1 hypothetical protein BUE76_20445 [Cnuella takakiae]
MIKALLFCSILLHTHAFAQGNGSIVYLDNTLAGTNKKNAILQGTLVPVAGGYLVECNSADGKLLYAGTYADKKLQTKQGLTRFYHADGTVQSEGMMEANEKTGIWRYWHPNKQLKDSGSYVGGFLEGTWKTWYDNGQLKSVTQFKPIMLTSVRASESATRRISDSKIEGPYLSYYQNGKPEAVGMYHGGVMVGKWEWFRKNGQPSIIEYYNRIGKLDSMRCYDSLGIYQGEFCSIEKPAVLKRFGDFREYMANNFSWPDSVLTVKHTTSVKMRFVVNANGKLEQLKVESSERLLAEAVHRFIRSLPDWYPAVLHNKEVGWKDQVEVIYWPTNNRVYPFTPLNAVIGYND